MSGELSAVDMFGHPVSCRQEGRGRPAIEWDRATSNRVILCFWRGLTVKAMADPCGMSVPTLRKVYFSEVQNRKLAKDRCEMLALERYNAWAEAGSVAAQKALTKEVDRLRMRDQAQAIASPAHPKPAAKLGIKEQRRADARAAGAGSDWATLIGSGPSEVSLAH